MERTTCCVVGGGPAGMMLGLLLARAGVEVTVLEKHADFLRDFRGDTVHPSTMAVLDELGLGERFAALPQSRLQELAFPTGDVDPATGDQEQLAVGDFRRLSRWGVRHPYIAMVPQWDLLSLLAEAGEAEPTFTLRMSTEVTALRRDRDGRVTGVGLRDAGGAEGELAADLVVACDGRSSTARAAAGLDGDGLVDHRVPMDAWWFRLPRRDDEGSGALLPRSGQGRFAVVIPRKGDGAQRSSTSTAQGYFQIAYLGPKGGDAALRARGIEAFRADVAALLPALADRVDTIASMDDVKHLDVRLDRLRRWHVEGLLCLGDAAHAMSPIGGVGINLAVQDAVAAAGLLAEPLRRGRADGAALDRVRRRRLLPTLAVQGMQRLMHRVIVEPTLAGRASGPPRPLLRLVRALPALSVVPALLVGVGIRPEHAPDFARREPQAAPL